MGMAVASSVQDLQVHAHYVMSYNMASIVTRELSFSGTLE